MSAFKPPSLWHSVIGVRANIEVFPLTNVSFTENRIMYLVPNITKGQIRDKIKSHTEIIKENTRK